MQGRIGCIGALTAIAFAAFGAYASATTFTNSTAINFGAGAANNGSVYPSAITVSGLTGRTTDVNVKINGLSHTFPDDVGLVLVAPTGEALLLQDGAGEDPDLTSVTTTFDDQATDRLPDLTAWASGSYRPTSYYEGDAFPAPGPGTSYLSPGPSAGSATLASAFGNRIPNGSWNLFARDFVNGDGGTIAGGWSLELTTSTTPPQTSLDAGPSSLSASATASFAFSSNISATFQCSLDGAAFAPCSSRHEVSGLSDGAHVFAVRAVDVAGGADPSPAEQSFTVDTTAPTTSIDSGPSGIVNTASASFGFSANEAATFECRLDDGALAPCDSPKAYAGLPEGLHVFQLRATDTAGNSDETGAVRAFTVQTTLSNQGDAVNPTAKVTKPKIKKGKRKAKIEFTGSDNSTAASALEFTCSLDGKPAAPCTSPTTVKRLKVGSHSFFVVAQDAAGNLSAPATASFKVKPKN